MFNLEAITRWFSRIRGVSQILLFLLCTDIHSMSLEEFNCNFARLNQGTLVEWAFLAECLRTTTIFLESKYMMPSAYWKIQPVNNLNHFNLTTSLEFLWLQFWVTSSGNLPAFQRRSLRHGPYVQAMSPTALVSLLFDCNYTYCFLSD